MNQSVWLKRCLACGEPNQPLAFECEHCGYDKFVWDDKDRPPHIQPDSSMKPIYDLTPFTLDFETQVELSIRGIYPFDSYGTTVWPFVFRKPTHYRKVEEQGQ